LAIGNWCVSLIPNYLVRCNTMIPYLLSRTTSLLRRSLQQNTLTRWESRSVALCSTSSTHTTTASNNTNIDGGGNHNKQSYTKCYTLNGIGKGSIVKIATDTGHSLTTDLPRKMGGSDSAPQPVETLIAAWMGCTHATALFVGRHIIVPSSSTTDDIDSRKRRKQRGRVVIDHIEFENIRAYRDERGAVGLPISRAQMPGLESRVHRITGIIRVSSSQRRGGADDADGADGVSGGLSSEQMELLKEQTEIRCPVANMMIASGCSIDVEWVDASSGGSKRNNI